MTSALSAEDFDDLHDFIRAQVAAGYARPEEILDEAVELFAENAADPIALRAAAQAIAEQALAVHVIEQAQWPQPTDCERLDAAFAELEGDGILARQHYSCCATCGVAEIHGELDRAEKSGSPARGFTFFHMQDTEHAIAGESLYLSYGSADRDSQASVAIGREVVDVLGRHGLTPAWNGKIAHRIALPVTWQRRRTPPG